MDIARRPVSVAGEFCGCAEEVRGLGGGDEECAVVFGEEVVLGVGGCVAA